MEKKYVILPGDDAVQNWFEENIDKDCSASSAVYKFRLWLEEMTGQQQGQVWVKASERLPGWRTPVKWRLNGVEMKKYDVEYISQAESPGHWMDLEWLDESSANNRDLDGVSQQPKRPTFWDVAEAYKWAAEYRDEIGGQLTLYNDQWTLISEDEDGNENETQDLTRGNLAELYCLQKGFAKENDNEKH